MLYPLLFGVGHTNADADPRARAPIVAVRPVPIRMPWSVAPTLGRSKHPAHGVIHRWYRSVGEPRRRISSRRR